MKTALITGSAGLVGTATMKVFQEAGYQTFGVDNGMRSSFFNTKVKQSAMYDISNEKDVEILFNDHGPFDVIVHAAAQPSHDYSKDHVLEDFDINARGTVLLLEATKKYCPNATFIYVSTDKVYGENMEGEKLSNEELGLDFAGARSPFGCSKAAGDMYVQEYGNYFGMKTGIFRPGCITGKNHEGAELHGFLAHLAKCIRIGTTYKIFGNGKNVRDQIHAEDLASAFLEFAKNPKCAAVYNIGGGSVRAVSVLEAGELIAKEVGKPFLHAFYGPRKGDRLWDIHDITKFRTDYPNWEYKYDLSAIIKDVCEKSL